MEIEMSDSIKILTLSDIFWHEVGMFRRLIALVAITKPNLVLLAGDLVNDSPGLDFLYKDKPYSGFWQNVSKFLDFLEEHQIQCYVVRGNWDERQEYADLIRRKYVYIEDISNKLVEFRGIKIWGIPHSLTTKKSTMPKITGFNTDQVDIILTHADGTRRMMLFEYPARLIITGHSDEKLCLVRDKAFVSFSNFPNQYAVIDYSTNDIGVQYFYSGGVSSKIKEQLSYSMRVLNGFPVWTNEEDKNWSSRYKLQMESLLSLKERAGTLNSDEKREAINQLLSIGVSKAQIEEHIPGAYTILKPTKPKKTPPE
jgi:predicted phosphodiesterase